MTFLSWARIAAGCLAIVMGIAAPRDLHAQSTLIPVTARRDMIFDHSGTHLYITTSNGFVQPYNLSTGQLETAYNLGGSLNGVDIAYDDSFLLIAQSHTGVSQGTFHKLNLTTSTVTNINYTLAFAEGGAWDVAIGSNGLAVVTTQFLGSGWTPLRQIDLATNAVAIRTDAPGSGGAGMVRQDTQIHRSANGTRFYFLESNISNGPIFTYSAVTNTFGPSANTNTFLDSASAAVNRNGGLLATRTFNNGASLDTAPDFNFVHSFNGIDGGVAFDAVTDTLYGVNSTTDQIIAYDTNTFAEKFRLSIGEAISRGAAQFDTGTLVASADGHHLALETTSGIRLFSVPPGPTPTPSPATLGNISTRLQVGTGDRVMIAGFIVQGNSPKTVLIRAIGPSLTQFGVPDVLANPQLELHDANSLIGMNDDWQTTQIGGVITSDQVAEIQNSGLPPTDPLESALIATLPPGNYTAIVRGVNNTTGNALAEVYDLSANSGSLLANISTRGFVQTGDNVMIGGFIVVTQPTRVIIRAIGPSLTQFGVPDAMANPTLELHDHTQALIGRNDDWQTTQIGGIITSDQVAEIQNSQLAPTNPAESAIIATLQPGNYTAIVRGVNNTAGTALVEVYSLQ